jgi:hypothetical protein
MVFVFGELTQKYEIRAKRVMISFKQPKYHRLRLVLKRVSDMVI